MNSTELPTQQVKRVLDYVLGGLPVWTTKIAITRTTSHQARNSITALCVTLLEVEVVAAGLQATHIKYKRIGVEE